MNSQIFVSKYQLALPDEAEMRAFVEARLQEELPAPADSARQITKTKVSQSKPTKPHARRQVKRD
jgi:hypothetical protein